MRLLAMQETVETNVNYDYLAKTNVSLSHNEFRCLEMALSFLREQCYSKNPRSAFTQLKDRHLISLKDCFKQSKLNKQLYLLGQIEIELSIDPNHDLEWLFLALEVGLTEDVVSIFAEDEANYKRDVDLLYAKNDEDRRRADDMFYVNFKECQQYYRDIAKYSSQLLAKFRDIL